MAFSLPNYTDPATGAAVTHFVITGLQIDLVNNAFTVLVNGYVSKADYDAGKAPMPNCSNIPFLINGDLYAAFLAVTTGADLPAGSTQQQVLGELLATLANNMLTFPFFEGAQLVS
jgi:hypothetical protein